MLKIVTAPNLVLSQTAKPVLRVDSRILNLIGEMKKVLLSAKDPEGVGLAAPQVGKPLALFIAKPASKSPISVFINPKIVSSIKSQISVEKENPIHNTKYKIHNAKLEGCLSLPNIWGEVKRDPQITISYLDEKGENHTKSFKGFMATVIQHETDHLNGILFPKRVLEQKGKLYKSRKNKKGEDIFEEMEI